MASNQDGAKYHANGLAAPPPVHRQTTRTQATASSNFYPRTIATQTATTATSNKHQSANNNHLMLQSQFSPHHHHHQEDYQFQHRHQQATSYAGEEVQVMLRRHQQSARTNHHQQQQHNQMTAANSSTSSSPRHCDADHHHQQVTSVNYHNNRDDDDDDEQTNSGQHYAEQLRRSQAHQLIGAHSSMQQQIPANRTQQHAPHGSPPSQVVRGERAGEQSASRPQQQHVNFGQSRKSSQQSEGGGESSRKKKYLTAKYGVQQMSLIKKRLKIEMWLHEKLQELAKLSKIIDEEELDEIDIDLDQLLDLEDDAMRTHSLRKTLAPLADLPRDSIDQFISDVLEQSKLL